jgi:hypothetical protein
MTTRRGQQDQLLDRLPPHDIDAEKAVIASLLVDGDAIDQVAPILQPGDFFREALGWVYEACLALRGRGEAINQVTAAHELARRNRLEELGGNACLSRLVAELPTPIGVEHYARIVKRDAVYRQGIRNAALDVQAFYSANGNLPHVLEEAEARVRALREMAAPILVRALNPVALTLDEVLCAAHDSPEWAVEGLIVRGGLNIIGGDAETAKSYAAEDLLLAVATGQPWLGREVAQGRALVVDEENDLDLYGERLPGLLRGRGIAKEIPNLRFLIRAGVDLSIEEGIAKVETEIRAFNPTFVLLETLSMLRGSLDENSSTDMAELTRRLQYLRSLNGHAQVLTHHLAKPGKVQRDLLRGSTQIRAAADSILEFAAMLPGGPFQVHHSKSRRARRQANFSFAIEEREPGCVAIAALQAARATGSYEALARDNLESLLADGQWHARSDVQAACREAAPGANEDTVKRGLSRAIGALEAEGRLEKQGIGRNVYLRMPGGQEATDKRADEGQENCTA